jgi:hypothetical protein
MLQLIMEGGSLELEEVSISLERVVLFVTWYDERDIVSVVVDWNVEEVKVVIVWSSVCVREAE